LTGLDDADPASLLVWIRRTLAERLPPLDRIDLEPTPGCGAMLCWGEEGPGLPV
jgi:6-pyruvoyltetrahydropterin/6-carboxytetrahydropterin synthase